MSKVKMKRMLDLLQYEVTSPGAMATEIERNGVGGEDQYGRFKIYPPQHPECLKALESLARHYDLSTNYDEYGMDPDPVTDRLLQYGWPPDNVPTFEEPALVAREEPRPQTAARERNNLLRELEGLKRLLLGELTGDPHPACAGADSSERLNKLIAILEDYSAGREGLKRATLMKNFAAAAELWEIA